MMIMHNMKRIHLVYSCHLGNLYPYISYVVYRCLVRILRFVNRILGNKHGINSKDIVTNSSRNRKIDLPSVRHILSLKL